ncbi:glycoside hydrolase domain-containing protein [Metabacillus iocasae]|uniref:Rv2525c-like glycoside hydrolase-like domain-containing protein n=1 Tax=Priestia iocasae TaxID=2291674 RepID=A0ABS2QWL5_9BACI|nr:glycoside hydrolase domain-containing protein [Metabacillus iocasae]MBM7703851.1 hypothetical protein [Metabacillus iocasae]
MNNHKSYTVIFAVFLCVLTFITVLFLSDSSKKTPSSHQVNQSSNEPSIQNNIQNNIQNKGEGEIKNQVTNSLEVNDSNEIKNSLSNNIDVSVNVTIDNSIENNIQSKKQPSSSPTESTNREPSNKEQQQTDKENDAKQTNRNNEQPEFVWGIDSASLTTEEFNACVQENFGTPSVWGRYLGDKENVSKGITKKEAELIQSTGAKVLLINNQFEDARGYENGKEQAKVATELASELDVPEGVVIFADIEPNYPVDANFIIGWFEGMANSSYKPGIYGIFDKERALTTAFEEAAAQNQELQSGTYIWTASPNTGISTEKNAPAYKPDAPKDSLIAGWQYGIDAEACNIDTNLFSSELLNVLW